MLTNTEANIEQGEAEARAAEADIPLDRNRTIQALRLALKARTGRTWSVRGGRGSVWGWITITAPPSRCGTHREMSDEDREILAAALDHNTRYVSTQGVDIPASTAYRREYLARACGQPYERANPYWD